MLTKMVARLRQWARALQCESHALYLAARDPRTPLVAKLVVMAIAAYALSPIDLIPDFIPVLGFLDDVIIVPLGIALAVRLIPEDVLTECRRQALESTVRPRSLVAAFIIAALWVLGIIVSAFFIMRVARFS